MDFTDEIFLYKIMVRCGEEICFRVVAAGFSAGKRVKPLIK